MLGDLVSNTPPLIPSKKILYIKKQANWREREKCDWCLFGFFSVPAEFGHNYSMLSIGGFIWPADRTALGRGGVGRVGGGDGLREVEEGVQLIPTLPHCGCQGDGVAWKRLEIWKSSPAPPLGATNLKNPWDRD